RTGFLPSPFPSPRQPNRAGLKSPDDPADSPMPGGCSHAPSGMLLLASGWICHHRSHMQVVTDQIRSFLQYIAVQFIEHPAEAQLKVLEQGPGRVRFKLVLRQSDVALLIGRNGFSASAIRGVAKAAAERS